MEIICGKKTHIITLPTWQQLTRKYSHIVLDLGTGDGKFPYQSAKQHPDILWVGIDADRNSLEEYSHKIYRKPNKGGLPNVLYVIANATSLPSELYGCAEAIWIILPWGSLLHGLVHARLNFLENLSAVSKCNCKIQMLINYDLRYEAAEIQKLQLPKLSLEYIENVLAQPYKTVGLEFCSYEEIDNSQMTLMNSTWARRLGFGRERKTIQIIWRKI